MRVATSITPASASHRIFRVPASSACRNPRRKKTPSTPSIATKPRERDVEEKVKEIYFELFYHAKTLAILDRNQDELQQIQQIAETRYRVGQGLQQDLIKAQLQTTEILKEHAMHHQEEDQEQLELKQLLGRDPDSRNIEIGDIEPTHLQLDSSQLAQLSR